MYIHISSQLLIYLYSSEVEIVFKLKNSIRDVDLHFIAMSQHFWLPVKLNGSQTLRAVVKNFKITLKNASNVDDWVWVVLHGF